MNSLLKIISLILTIIIIVIVAYSLTIFSTFSKESKSTNTIEKSPETLTLPPSTDSAKAVDTTKYEIIEIDSALGLDSIWRLMKELDTSKYRIKLKE